MTSARGDATEARCREVLEVIGCPSVRKGEGSDEWNATKGAYTPTPDLVAGPLVGAGDPSDFYIDVFAPKGDQFVTPRAGSPQAAVALLRAVAERGSFRLDQLDVNGPLYGTMNKKLAKYAGSRSNSPMFGIAMYFTMTGDQYVGPALAGLAAPLALDRAFGLTEHLGPGTMDKIMRRVMSPGQSQGDKVVQEGLDGQAGVLAMVP